MTGAQLLAALVDGTSEALFAPDAELHGLGEVAVGPAAIVDRLGAAPRGWVLGDGLPQAAGAFAATLLCRSRPSLVTGELTVFPDGERIGRLVARVLPRPVSPRERVSVRALLTAPGPRLLLFCCAEPGDAIDRRWWITPGGGRDPGESDRATLARELREEVGFALEDAPGPCVWTRTHTFAWKDGAIRQHERFYLVRVDRPIEPRPSLADEGTLHHRWWALDELLATAELLAPRRLATLWAALLTDGPPDEPLDVGV